jgi:3'(2'), 5'-bisphosphate nucleotidase
VAGPSASGAPTKEGGDYALELAAARSLAIGGGEIVMRWTSGGFRVEDKAGQPVTQADRESNAFIVDGLAKRFPADAILAEETPVTDGAWRSAERCWVVDPLDGTSDFVKGRVGFCVMIGLLVRGRPVLGAVNVPKAGRMFLGAVGAGAFEERGARLDGCEERRPLAVSKRARGSELRVIASIAHRDERLEAALAALAPAETLSVGSVGYKVGKIAADEADLYIATTSAISLWDTCAPEAILDAAGGRFLDLDGQPLSYAGPGLNHPRGLLATNGACGDEVVATLEGRFPQLD